MASKLTSADIARILIQADMDSPPVDDNFQALKDKINEVITAVDAITATGTIVEVSNARPDHDNLKERLDSKWSGQYPYIKSGGVVTVSSAGNTVDITAGEACINGIDVAWAASTSGAISFTGSNTRYDVVAVKSDSTIEVITGTASADPVLPSVAVATRKALAILLVTTTTITVLEDARNQGCIYLHDGAMKYQWYIQSAIDDLDSDLGGEIVIGGGRYYEELDLSGKSNITLRGLASNKIYRISSTNRAIKSINTSGNETTGIKLIGLNFYGNSKTGANELLKFEYTDEFEIRNCRFDSNNSSTATEKNWLINQCDNFFLDMNLNLDNSGDIDYSETNITNSTKYQEDGYYTGQVTFCGTTAQKAQMIKQGWVELTAMDDKFLRVDKDTAASTGGNDSLPTHQHQLDTFGPFGSSGIGDYVVTETDSGGTLRVQIAGAANVYYRTAETDASYYGAAPDNKPAYYTLIALIHR